VRKAKAKGIASAIASAEQSLKVLKAAVERKKSQLPHYYISRDFVVGDVGKIGMIGMATIVEDKKLTETRSQCRLLIRNLDKSESWSKPFLLERPVKPKPVPLGWGLGSSILVE